MTPTMKKACEAAITCCNDVRPMVEFLEKLAEAEPAWAERAQELRSKLDHTQEVGEAGLMLMGQMK